MKRIHLAKKIRRRLIAIQELMKQERDELVYLSRDENIDDPDSAMAFARALIDNWIMLHEKILELPKSPRKTKKEKEKTGLSAFDELCLGIYLHLKKTHFPKDGMETAIIAKTKDILEAVGISDKTRNGKSTDVKPYHDAEVTPGDTNIGKRIQRIFETPNKNKSKAISRKTSEKGSKRPLRLLRKQFIEEYQDLPCMFTPVSLSDIGVDLDITSTKLLGIFNLRP